MPYRFSFHCFGENFECSLKRGRCTSNRRDGQRCKRESYLPFDVCWQHLRIDYNLTIKKTSLPGYNFKGLFAYDHKDPGGNSIVFRKPKSKSKRTARYRIIKYIGDIVDKKEIDRRYGKGERTTAPYAFKLKKKDSFADAACRRGTGSFANTRPGHQNARFVKSGALYPTKTIRNGDEIFASYGRAYKIGCGHSTRYHRRK